MRPQVQSKLVRILFIDGSTYSSQAARIETAGDMVILSGPGRLFSIPQAMIRRIFVGRV